MYRSSRWPLWRDSCTTWTANVIAVGRDFVQQVLEEQSLHAATRENPVVVHGGRLRFRRDAAVPLTASVILAHECGHTAQARRMGLWYWPAGAMFTRFCEGPRWWNHFENEASAIGQFGGLVG